MTLPTISHSGRQPDTATGGTRHHPKGHQPLPQESPRSVPSAPREGSSGEVMIWLGIVVLILVGGFLGGFHG